MLTLPTSYPDEWDQVKQGMERADAISAQLKVNVRHQMKTGKGGENYL